MKHIFSFVAIFLCTTSINAQSLKITLNSGEVNQFNASEIASVEFLPENAIIPTDLSGEYEAMMKVSLPAMNQDNLVNEQTKFSLTKTSENVYDITLPSCSYTMGTSVMTLPGVTVKDVTLTEVDGGFAFDTTFSGTDGQDKTYSGTLKGTFNADGKTFSVTESMKYGSMPFDLVMDYTPIVE